MDISPLEIPEVAGLSKTSGQALSSGDSGRCRSVQACSRDVCRALI
jgi:hypothetical protein